MLAGSRVKSTPKSKSFYFRTAEHENTNSLENDNAGPVSAQYWPGVLLGRNVQVVAGGATVAVSIVLYQEDIETKK